MKMQLPCVFRVLVVDDKVGDRANADLQEFIRNVIYYIVKNTYTPRMIDYIDIRFASTAERGVELWQNQVFDLTLVDSDFAGQLKDERANAVSSFFDVHARHKGVFAFQLLRSLQNLTEAYEYRARTCRVYIWTSLPKSDVGSILGVLATGPVSPMSPTADSKGNGSDQPEEWYIPKQARKGEADPYGALKGAVQMAALRTTGAFSPEQMAERFIGLYKIRKELPKDILSSIPFLDGYLLQSDRKLHYLDCLNNEADARPYLHFTIRKPYEDFNPGCSVSSIYLGPASRDVNAPLGALIAKLFRSPSKTAGTPSSTLDINAPLSTREQCELLYRKVLTTERTDQKTKQVRLAIRVPEPKVERSTAPPGGFVEAAATPLTGVSTVGLQDAQNVLIAKAKALLCGPFDRVVLKTTYQNSPAAFVEPIRWPALQAQSHHRTRCLRSVGHPRTLWNTGNTALEMFTPQMLNAFLRKCTEKEHIKIFGDKCERLIVSLGSKYPQAEHTAGLCYRGRDARKHESAFRHDLANLIWSPLFDKVFAGVDGYFPAVEVNVRHYLRENVAFHLGGDEYLSPDVLGCGATFTPSYDGAIAEFRWWMEVLHEIAQQNAKRLILKFPFRSDILAFIQEVYNFCTVHKPKANGFGIQGICLINAFKSGACEIASTAAYSPAWYGKIGAWGDSSGREVKYQMSGEMLNASRNMLLYKVLDGRRTMGLQELELHFGGGIVSQDDLRFCRDPSAFIRGSLQCPPVSVQIGTWALLSLDLKGPLPEACKVEPPKSGQTETKAVEVCDGMRCPKCVKDNCRCNAIVLSNGRVYVDPAKCSTCGQCIDQCPRHVFVSSPVGGVDIPFASSRNGRRPKHPIIRKERCVGCGMCTKEKGGCPSAVIEVVPLSGGVGKHCAMVKLASNCVECGRCVKLCPQSAISLGDPMILPRICFMLHKQCIGCGKCSRSFYCDTFLDRRGESIHPLMDPRNCTGCGLCAQICPTGALQLFKPEHVAVLISSPGERSDLLKVLQIPHLTYDPVDDLRLFGDPEDSRIRRARLILKDGFAFRIDRLRKWAVSLWVFRLTHDCGPAGFDNDAPWDWLGVKKNAPLRPLIQKDELRTIAAQVKAKVTVLLDKLGKSVNTSGLDSRVATRAFVWSQLIWSDPGHVLWESPIMVIRTEGSFRDGDAPLNQSPQSTEDVHNALVGLKQRDFAITSHWTLLQMGEVCHIGTNTAGPFLLAFNDEQINEYAKIAALGQHRLLGLDLRACPNMLKTTRDNSPGLTASESMHVSGLPWEGVDGLEKTASIAVIVEEVKRRLEAVKALTT